MVTALRASLPAIRMAGAALELWQLRFGLRLCEPLRKQLSGRRLARVPTPRKERPTDRSNAPAVGGRVTYSRLLSRECRKPRFSLSILPLLEKARARVCSPDAERTPRCVTGGRCESSRSCARQSGLSTTLRERVSDQAPKGSSCFTYECGWREYSNDQSYA